MTQASDPVTNLIGQLGAQTGIPLPQARLAAIVVVRALLPLVDPSVRPGLEALLAELGPEHASPADAVATALDVPRERAHAITGKVIEALLEAMGPDAGVLFAALPPELRPEPAARSSGADVSPRAVAGRPRVPQVVRAHSHSIARSNDPHAETRLSSARALVPPERTLADGKPGSRRPIAGTPPGEED